MASAGGAATAGRSISDDAGAGAGVEREVRRHLRRVRIVSVPAFDAGGANGGLIVDSTHSQARPMEVPNPEYGKREEPDPDFVPLDVSGRGKRKLTGEGHSECESGSQMVAIRACETDNQASSSVKGKNKFVAGVEDDTKTEKLEESEHHAKLAEFRRSRGKRSRLQGEFWRGASSVSDALDLSESPVPFVGDEMGRVASRVARFRYDPASPSVSAAMSTDAEIVLPQEGSTGQRQGKDEQAASSVDAVVMGLSDLYAPGQEVDQSFGENAEVMLGSSLEDESSTGRAPSSGPQTLQLLSSGQELPPVTRLERPASNRIRNRSSRSLWRNSETGVIELDTETLNRNNRLRPHHIGDHISSGSRSVPMHRSGLLPFIRTGLGRSVTGGSRSQPRSYQSGAGSRHRFPHVMNSPTGGHSSSNRWPQALIDLDEIDSPRPGNHEAPIELEDEPPGAMQQLAEDERLARALHEEFNGPFPAGNPESLDAEMARALQEMENPRVNQLFTRTFFPNHLDELLGQRRSWYRPRPHVSSRNRGANWRRIHNRNGLAAATSTSAAPSSDTASGSNVLFPSNLPLEMRLQVLEVLETAFEDHHLPVNMRLAQVDRDFNENDYEMLLALDEDNRHNGASAEHIQQLPVRTLQPTDVSDEPCAVCLEVPISGDQVRRLPCMHSFHQSCIDLWLPRQAVCPVCKAHI